MNPYTVIILATLLVQFVLDFVANCLNLLSLNSEIPPDLIGLYNPERYKKSQEYTRTTTRFGLLESIFDLGVLLIFWFSGGFEWLDEFVRRTGHSEIVTGLLYVAALAIGSALLSLPFQIYSTFIIEEKYGFNRTTPRTFILDRLKGLAITAILGGALLALLLWFFSFAGDKAWLWCWIASTIFVLIIQFIAPVWIMPLFNKFTPLPDGELKNAIEHYAQAVDFTFKDISVMDGSKRSSKANAFFTGFGRNKRIALFDTLVNEQTLPELLSVLAHEIGHYKKKHVFTMTIAGILQTGVLFFLLSVFIGNRELFAAFGMKHISVYAGLVFFGLLYQPISFLLSIVMHAVSRHNEFAADRYSVETGQ